MVRLSGSMAISIGQKIFLSIPPLGRRLRRVEYGHVLDAEGREIDTGLAWAFRRPHSYTGEDTVEITCHNSRIVLETLVQVAIELGAVLAGPGEFTRRAFLNGHLDLIQAEAVLEIIQAENRDVLNTAYGQASGRLSDHIRQLKDRIVKALSLVEVGLDFSDGDTGITIGQEQLQEEIRQALAFSRSLIDTFEGWHRRQLGHMVALIGRPNVGKSTLLNALLGEDKAIVTPIPGTTRDLVEGKAVWRGESIRLIDTAGIQATGDLVEQEGVKRTHLAINSADMLLVVLDASTPWVYEDEEVLSLLKLKSGIILLNKIDLPRRLVIPKQYSSCFPHLGISALTGMGLGALQQKILEMIPKPSLLSGGVGVTRQRHQDTLLRTSARLETAQNLLTNYPVECVAVELHDALMCLGEMLGDNLADDVLDLIFSEFCIGK